MGGGGGVVTPQHPNMKLLLLAGKIQSEGSDWEKGCGDPTVILEVNSRSCDWELPLKICTFWCSVTSLSLSYWMGGYPEVQLFQNTKLLSSLKNWKRFNRWKAPISKPNVHPGSQSSKAIQDKVIYKRRHQKVYFKVKLTKKGERGGHLENHPQGC